MNVDKIFELLKIEPLEEFNMYVNKPSADPTYYYRLTYDLELQYREKNSGWYTSSDRDFVDLLRGRYKIYKAEPKKKETPKPKLVNYDGTIKSGGITILEKERK